jgi:hypothetical protein
MYSNFTHVKLMKDDVPSALLAVDTLPEADMWLAT